MNTEIEATRRRLDPVHEGVRERFSTTLEPSRRFRDLLCALRAAVQS